MFLIKEIFIPSCSYKIVLIKDNECTGLKSCVFCAEKGIGTEFFILLILSENSKVGALTKKPYNSKAIHLCFESLTIFNGSHVFRLSR